MVMCLSDEVYTKVFMLFEKAADQGHVDAQYKLGWMYYHGCGVEKDPSQEIKWYEKAAQQGHVNAQYELGRLYYLGQSVDQDNDQGFYWIDQASSGE